jgi:ABC-2 type transport system permease protein
MPVDGLAALSTGESARQPSVRRISLYRDLDEPPLQNPLAPAGGLFDLSFVIIWLLPLALIAALQGVISADRERGTWRLVAVTADAPGRVLAARLMWPAVMFVGATIAAGAVAVALASPPDTTGWARFAAWGGLVIAYTGFWILCCGAVSSRSATPPVALGALGLLWITLVWVVPGLIDRAIVLVAPPPDGAAAALAVRETGRDLEEKLPQMLEAVYARYPDWRPSPDVVAAARRPVPGGPASRDVRRVYVPELAAVEAAAPFDMAATARRARTEQLVRRLSVLSPALAFQLLGDHAAGTSAERFIAFERHANEAERAWHAFFAPRIMQLRDMTREDLDNLPTPPPFSALPSAAGLAAPLAGVGLWTAAAAVWLGASRRRLRDQG